MRTAVHEWVGSRVKRALLFTFLILILVVCTLVILRLWDRGVTANNLQKIHLGMTRRQVEAVLGRPAPSGDMLEADPEEIKTLPIKIKHVERSTGKYYLQIWHGRGGYLMVVYSEDDIVVHKDWRVYRGTWQIPDDRSRLEHLIDELLGLCGL